MPLRRIALVATLIAAGLVWSGPAYAVAANAYEDGSTLYYVADSGAANSLTIQVTANGFLLDDAVPVSTGYNCKPYGTDGTAALCQPPGITTLWIETADGNDYVNNLTSLYTVVHAGDGNDTVWGGYAEDALWGEAGNDYLNGWSGDDWLHGGIGTDQMYGGSGAWDIASYSDSPVGVVVDLDGVADDGASGENDTIGSDIEVLHGSKFNDWLIGNAGSNYLYGLAGNDYMFGLDGNDFLYGDGFSDYAIGADYFSGGNGTDYVSYSDHTAAQAVTADLDGASGDDGTGGEADTIASDVENLDGTPGSDWLVGNGGPNTISGEAGNDVVYGLAGNDILSGQDGADTLNGGLGTDACDVGPGGTSATACE